MRRDLVTAPARRRSDLRDTAAEHYRQALADGSPTVRVYLLAAAGYDRLAAVRRALTDRAALGDTARRLRHRAAGVIDQAGVSGAGELSISLSGAPAVLAAASTLALQPSDGGSLVPLPTQRQHVAGATRLLAELPPARFSGGTWRVAVTDGSLALPLLVPLRAIAARWPADGHWPPRLGRDAGGQLTVTGRRPGSLGRSHELTLGLSTALVSWPAGDAAVQLRLSADRAGAVIVRPGVRTGDGTATATLDLLELAARPADVWTIDVWTAGGATGDASGAAGWAQLQLPLGEWPPLGEIATLRLPAAGTSVTVRLGYDERNRLTVTTAPVGPEPTP